MSEKKSEEATIVHCELVKKDDKRFVAECKAVKDGEEDCPGCAEAVAVGWALNYIKPYDEKLADKLFKEVTAEKISPDNAMDQCVGVAEQKGDKDLVDTLKELKVIMHKPLSELEEEEK